MAFSADQPWPQGKPIPLPVVHHHGYAPALPAGHRFPMAKFALLFECLQDQGLARPANTHIPAPATREALLRVHDRDYVDAVRALFDLPAPSGDDTEIKPLDENDQE